MRNLWRKAMAGMAAWLCGVLGWVPVPAGDYEASAEARRDLTAFCGRSGFLRDGRSSAGRHAERKVRACVERMDVRRAA